MRRARAAIAVGVALATAGAAGAARAEGPEEQHPTYSRYERESIKAALAAIHGKIEEHPKGKRIERVDVVTLEVIEKRDPAPDFLNWFHVTTKRPVVKREVLQIPGERFDPALVEETCRNLRGKPQLSLVLCVPVVGDSPGTVRLLVITKDVWSIRLNWNLAFSDGKLQQLIIQPSETNILGTHQVASAPNFDLENDTISLGASYSNPRLLGSWISTGVTGGVILNRATGQAEGSFGSFNYGQPLYSTRVEWAWGGSAAWRKEISRRYVGGVLDTYDAAATATDDKLPWVYSSDLLSGSFSVTRSFGLHFKHNFELGISASRSIYRVPDDPNHPVSPEAKAEFIALEVPVSDTRIGPFFQYHTFQNRYMSVLNFNQLGLQEDVQLGFEAYLRFAPVLKALHSTRDFVGSFVGVQYTVPLRDGIVRGYTQSSVELAEGFPDAAVSGGFRVETPTTPIGRLVFDGIAVDRIHDYLNGQSTLGGSDRLRGYPSNQFIGKNAFAVNFEYRSRPIEILTLQAAACLFFDVGDAFDDWHDVVVKRGIGFGLRTSLPQLNRAVFRLDWGFPLVAVSGVPVGWPGNFVVTFGQAFNLPGTGP